MEKQQWLSDLRPEQQATLSQTDIEIAFEAAQAEEGKIINLKNNSYLKKSWTGYVSWRGIIIEHYSYRDSDEEQSALALLTMRCLIAEGKRFPVNFRTTSRLSSFCGAPKNSPWLDAMLTFYAVFENSVGESVWVILKLSCGHSVAFKKIREAIVMEIGLDSEDSSGSYKLFHLLQARGYRGVFEKTSSYDGFVKAMDQARITPADIQRVLDADYSKVIARLSQEAA